MLVRPAIVGIAFTVLLGASSGCGGDSVATTATIRPDDTAVPTNPPADTTTTVTAATTTPTATSTTAMTSVPNASSPPTTVGEPLFDFALSGSADGWSVVNDTVMGGVSSGQLTVDDGVLVFTGELSLDNNGGFASVRSPLIDQRLALVWSDRKGPRIDVEGDGRTWTVEVRSDDLDGGWIAPFSTSAAGNTQVELPWTSFQPVTRFLDPRETDVPLDPARIVSIAFYLVDGIEAPFSLGIRSIS